MKLEKVNSKNVWELLKLEVDDSQRDFVATNTESIVEAYTTLAAGGQVFPFGVYDGGEPVGFLMIGYDDAGCDDGAPAVAKGNYSLWRLMIDKRFQGRGYGRRAIELALDFIRTFPCGSAEYCYLSYEPENLHAKRLYELFGFAENGEMDDDEVVAVLKL